MSVTSLSSILNEADLVNIPVNVQNTINCVLESKCKSLELQKQINEDKQKDFNDLQTKVDYKSDLVNRYKSHIAQLEDDLQKSRRELCDSIHSKDVLGVEFKKLELEIKSRDDRLNRLELLINNKNEETLELIENNHKLQIDLESARTHHASGSELNEDNFVNLLAEKKKLYDLECNYLKEELTRITNDFHEKSSKLNTVSSEFTTYRNEVEIQINDLKKENNSIKTQSAFLNNLIEKKDNQINELATKLNELHQHQDLLKEQYNIEKREHTDLLEYYKKLLDQSKQTKVQLVDKIKELHASFTESNEVQKATLEKLNEQNLHHVQEIEQRDMRNVELHSKIEELQSQLIAMSEKEMNDAVRQFYPTSNTLSRMFDKNMPLSTVYNKYEELQSKCEDLVAENDDLKLRIQEMILESEKNAPLIFYKTQENKKAFAEIEDYKIQLTKVGSDLENALSEIENYNKINNYLKRELKRYEKSNVDLSRQVQCLIQTVHEIKGNFVSNKFLINDQYFEKESAFDRAVSLNLVTFKNIEEVHENNQRLLSSIRELNEQYEDLQQRYNTKDGEQVSRKRIDELLVEIESLKEENRHKQEILSEMMAERESKLNQSGSNKLDSSIGGKDKQTGSSSTCLFKITSRAYLEEKILELTNSLEKRNDEFEKFKEKAKSEEQQLNVEIKNHLEQINNYQNEISKLSVQLDVMNENNKVLDATLARYNKDISMLKERNIKLEEQRKTLKERIGTFESKKNELVAKSDELKKDFDARSKLCNVLEKENDHLKLENSMIRQRIDEIKGELSENRKELIQFKTDHQVGSAKFEFDLKNQILMLEMKVANLESAITTLNKEKAELTEKASEKDKQAKLSISQLRQRVLALTNEMAGNQEEKRRLAIQLKEAQDKLKELEQSADDNANRTKMVKLQFELRNQLESKNKEIAKLTSELNDLRMKLKQKDLTLKQALRVNQEQIERFESEVAKKVGEIKKTLDESLLKERLMRKKIDSELKTKKEEIENLKRQIALLSAESEQSQQEQQSMQQQQQQQSMQQQQQQQSQNTSILTTITGKQVNTATIKPITVHRDHLSSQQTTSTTLPQAAVLPTPTAVVTSTPQTAYVVPTSIEPSATMEPISNLMNQSSTSFLLSSMTPSSSNETTLSRPNSGQQFGITSSSNNENGANQLKRHRMISFESLNPKKSKTDLNSQPSSSVVNETQEQAPVIDEEMAIISTATEMPPEMASEIVVENVNPTQINPTIVPSELVEEAANFNVEPVQQPEQEVSMPASEKPVSEEGEESDNDDDQANEDEKNSSADESFVEERMEDEPQLEDEDEDEEFEDDEEEADEHFSNHMQRSMRSASFQENSESNSQNEGDPSSDIICLSDEEDNANQAGAMSGENTQESRVANDDDDLSQAPLNEEDLVAAQFLETIQSNNMRNVAQSQRMTDASDAQTQLGDEASTISDDKNMQSITRPELNMPTFAALTRAIPASEEKSETIEYDNLVIDENLTAQNQESGDLYDNCLMSCVEEEVETSVIPASESQLIDTQSLDMQSNSLQMDQEIAGSSTLQPDVLSTSLSQVAPKIQQKKHKILRRPTIAPKASNEQRQTKDKANE